ncbi:hypothetical protein ACTI_23860 [Actinoplanes sp. OR16]|uniref:hypothetical protein n=1 Tax=Actinoplanes sp. OR16 TaxID=946334 RepID=UPI000F7202CD|nr:hypothetical protein [Actinoplanes sp. OR16]BBH65701.1 hypothetical protein ACTI_23860 [Actinoplanes sp. OR16]
MRAFPTVATAAVLVLAGCANSADSPGSPGSPASLAPSLSPSAVPGPSPSEIPREPGDKPPVTGWVSGSVTRGGQGPCYGFLADDGTRYALYNADGLELPQGKRAKVYLETTLIRIYCGPGNLMAMTAAEPIT